MNIFNIGPMELLLILVVVLIVFGPNKLPEVGASFGNAIRKFRQASKQLTEELDLEDLNPSTIADVLVARAEQEEEKAKAAEAKQEEHAAKEAGAEEKKPESEEPAPPAEAAPARPSRFIVPASSLATAAGAKPPTPAPASDEPEPAGEEPARASADPPTFVDNYPSPEDET